MEEKNNFRILYLKMSISLRGDIRWNLAVCKLKVLCRKFVLNVFEIFLNLSCVDVN